MVIRVTADPLRSQCVEAASCTAVVEQDRRLAEFTGLHLRVTMCLAFSKTTRPPFSELSVLEHGPPFLRAFPRGKSQGLVSLREVMILEFK